MRRGGRMARLEIGGWREKETDEERKKRDGCAGGWGLQKEERRVAQEGRGAPAYKDGRRETQEQGKSAGPHGSRRHETPRLKPVLRVGHRRKIQEGRRWFSLGCLFEDPRGRRFRTAWCVGVDEFHLLAEESAGWVFHPDGQDGLVRLVLREHGEFFGG